MGAYAYVAPTTVAEAVAVLGEHADAGSRAQVLAGGTDLLVQMRSVDRAPRTIVDIKKLAETNELNIGADETFIGAAIPSAALNENAELKALFPGLIEAADLIGSTQIQGRASLGQRFGDWDELQGARRELAQFLNGFRGTRTFDP